MPCGKAEQLAGHHLVQAVQAGNAVAQRCDGADLVDLDLRVVIRDLLAKKLRNLVCLDLSHSSFSGVSDQWSGISLKSGPLPSLAWLAPPITDCH
jgi:hypothetical protein